MEAKIMAAAEQGGDGEKLYTILDEEAIGKLVESKIMEVSDVLRVSRGTACSLLLHRNWTPRTVFSKWVDDRHKIGNNSVKQTSSSENECKICFETVETMVSGQCGHPFCVDCWKAYITGWVKDEGPGRLAIPCPEPGCKLMAGLDMVDFLAPADVKDRYYRSLYRSYVELSGGRRKWCPAPGCHSAIEFHGEGHVACGCSHKFCWSCMEESHRPVGCATAAEWLGMDSSEAESILWILNNTKPCPSCHSPIQKIDGCNHMRCHCSFDFCWVCLKGSDQNHFICNENVSAYEVNRKNLERDDDKFSIWYERWDYYEKLRRKDEMNDLYLDIDTLARLQGYAVDEVQCVIEAREQVLECRRLMKWSFVHGYYLSLGQDTRKTSLFNFMQEEAEGVLHHLQHCIKFELRKYFHHPSQDFNEFRSMLANLTKLTRILFENFVKEMENSA